MRPALSLMIVSQPGDETLFGGHLLAHHDRWKIISLTGGDNLKKVAEFRKAMRYWNIDDAEIWDHPHVDYVQDSDDEACNPDPIDNLAYCRDILAPAQLRLFNVLEGDQYINVVTHGPRGEIGDLYRMAVFLLVEEVLFHRIETGQCPTCDEPAEVLYSFGKNETARIPSSSYIGKIEALSQYSRPDIWKITSGLLPYVSNEFCKQHFDNLGQFES